MSLLTNYEGLRHQIERLVRENEELKKLVRLIRENHELKSAIKTQAGGLGISGFSSGLGEAAAGASQCQGNRKRPEFKKIGEGRVRLQQRGEILCGGVLGSHAERGIDSNKLMGRWPHYDGRVTQDHQDEKTKLGTSSTHLMVGAPARNAPLG